MNEEWTSKVTSAFLEAQEGMDESVIRSESDPQDFKDQTDLVLEKADELFPELKNYQRIIFRIDDNISYQLIHSEKLFYFCQVIRNFLVVVVEPLKVPEGDVEADEAELDSFFTSNLDNLQLNDKALGINFDHFELFHEFVIVM